MVDKILETMRAKKWEQAKWLVEALLLSKGVSKAERSSGSTKYQVPLSGVDLPTLLDMLLETLTFTELSEESTSRSSLRKAAEYLRRSSGTASGNGPTQEQPVPSATPSRKQLSSNRKYWPAEAKDEFWSLVKQLNKYDKENMAEGKRSPLQLSIAQEIVRRSYVVLDEFVSEEDSGRIYNLFGHRDFQVVRDAGPMRHLSCDVQDGLPRVWRDPVVP